MDVSLKGAKLETSFFFNIDNPITLVCFAGEEKLIKLSGTIKWVRLSKQLEQTLYHVGIKLDQDNIDLAKLGQDSFFADSYYAVKGQV